MRSNFLILFYVGIIKIEYLLFVLILINEIESFSFFLNSFHSGRAIRHIGDYAAILLVDRRYALDPSKKCQPHPTDKLPKWIKDSFIPSTDSYGEVHRLLHQFFKLNKK